MEFLSNKNKKSNRKSIWKAFIIAFLVFLLVFNWNSISWIFNYDFLSDVAYSMFQKDTAKADEDTAAIYIINKGVKESDFEYSGKKNSLEIPKLEVSVPLIFANSTDKQDLLNYLRKGVLLFPSSSLPGQKGETIILGHSAPTSWPNLRFFQVFTNLSKLEQGDEVIINFNYRKYEYRVTRKTVFDKEEEAFSNTGVLTNSDNVLILISCWPPGKDYKRIGVEAELIKPNK